MGKKSANAEKKLPPLKPILALPTWGQMWILSELWVLEKGNFDLGHPVQNLTVINNDSDQYFEDTVIFKILIQIIICY